jgi:hypothetical protein
VISTRSSALLLLGILLAALLPLRLTSLAGPGPYGVDASYYYQIARHVAEGDGLRTSVSIFHEGALRLPAPTRVYPLWPLLLGLVGRAIGLQPATQVLPPMLYFLDLILLYLLANLISQRMLGPDGEIVLQRGPFTVTTGHLAAAIFGTNRIFFDATAHPYTEGLAFACALTSLLLLARRPSSWLSDALSGAAAALAFLSRSQMAAFAAGIGLVLLVRAFRRADAWRVAVVWLIGAAMPVAAWYSWLSLHFPLSALNPFAGIAPFFKYSEIPALEPFVWWIETDSLTGWIRDRAPGVLVAFDPRGSFSYFASFGAAAAIVPLALGLSVARMARRDVRNGIDPIVAATVAGGAASNLVLLHFHSWHGLPWWFGWRHGLPYMFLIAAGLAYLLTFQSKVIRALVGMLVLISVITGAIHCVRGAEVAKRPVTSAEQSFIRWADSQEKTPTILTTQAQLLGMMTRANYHWTHCRESSEQTRTMLRHLPIDYVVVYRREARCGFWRDLNDLVEPYARFSSPDGAILLLRRRR